MKARRQREQDLNADIPWMRTHYLWDFAYLLHIDSNAIDALNYWDFIGYAYCIDEHWKQEEKRYAAQQF